MSTPRTLVVPEGVLATRIETPRGSFAAHVARGSAPVGHVLLVPGWTGSKEDFTQLLPELAAAGLDVTAYDQRGQFETPAAEGDDLSLAGLAADAAAVAAAVSDRPSHVLGHSFGGLVAQTAVVEHTDRWRSLSLLCTGPAALGDSDVRPLRRLADALATVPLIDVHRAREAAIGATHPSDVEAFLERRFVANSATSLRAMTLHLLDAPDRLDEVAATGLPAWVGYGADDDAWPLPVQDEMARRLNTQPVVLPGLGHSPAVEDPAALAAAWLPFLLTLP
ncbi:alpha/beta fold hydrolase [Aeromicrobium sp. Leaf350]|uniref:alpha/beta fold hydrolase n=1 Tax=Aeromicrobium sp. Leaf350 TaxID=2876565 RepID=UPI001E3E88CE|nr:alpha/beta hydrolase [Aeromicrobium sp. Leaf350]